MLEDIEVLCHSSIRMKKEKIIYIDPFKIDKKYNDADMIFITHEHYDHYSEEDIDRVKKNETIIIAPESLLIKLLNKNFKRENIIIVEPGSKYNIEGIKIETVPAYNVNKNFHPKEEKWVGYIIELSGNKYYIAGDTDITEENRKVRSDVAFVPIGGTYTMNYEEAAILINEIKPKIVVPIHYGTIVGTKEDAEKFTRLLKSQIEWKILIK